MRTRGSRTPSARFRSAAFLGQQLTDGFDRCAHPCARWRRLETENLMAKLALIYGMRLLPEEDLAEVREATVVLKNGKTARVTMHLIEGSKEEIETTFHQSVQAFFEMYPEIEPRAQALRAVGKH